MSRDEPARTSPPSTWLGIGTGLGSPTTGPLQQHNIGPLKAQEKLTLTTDNMADAG